MPAHEVRVNGVPVTMPAREFALLRLFAEHPRQVFSRDRLFDLCWESFGHKSQQINGVTVETDGYMEGNRWHSALTYRDADGTPCGEDHMDWQVYTPDEFGALAAGCDLVSRLTCAFSDERIAPSPNVARMQFVLEKR